MKSRAREQASSSIPLRGRHERGAEKNGKQMRSQGASRSENHDGKQQDMTTHEQNAKSDRQTRPEPAHNSHKSKTNDTPRPPRVRPRGQERERKKWSIWYYVVQFSSSIYVVWLAPQPPCHRPVPVWFDAHRGPGNTAPIDHFRSCSAVRSQPRRVVSSQRVRAGVGDETVPSSRESGMTRFLPGAPARALFVCESPPPTVMIVSSRGLHGRMT